MIDDKTLSYALPLPHSDNLLQQDVERIRQAIIDIDQLLYMQTNLDQQQDTLLNEKLRRVKLNQLLGEPLLTL
ncbi:hypothetical protein [Pseudoalteromonas luteoviolacea]|uniref:Uncharacterized protein n=1 Tax=Pseudoalteromonas luteoviolacea S4054 TaxID=1129367 RepID=A0A0F6A5L6_9GAMM|nr:hypothetical protein [Pseudoalteromonas luteoviolacea]AOT09352.1 hypothetical protein S4054249_16515 [Pseudoalteromonas luteoviolacea]AOT14264.1 hypothetical protein S40542_16485 [Pseudoalteromonas luteoviolacea]AOT19180.1 hypothetical protein S4054_16490 [Pseudoalteromonas luteoviolacea]KKE81136.1 hypothetical protein N479_23670 [Pseudoalteromonas luteoviolacea S4054]KZN73453.1 hypothetical protein N481_12085 [Pseudoalteromonas luteoviolacea S4047-1]